MNKMASILSMPPPPQRGLAAAGIFLVFGACMAAFAGITLLWPGTVLDKAWALNKPAHEQLAPIGRFAGPLFLLLSALLAAAAVGWFRRRLWGWRLAVGVIALQVAGDFVNLGRGDFLRGASGFIIAGMLLLFLLRPKVREHFR